MGIGVFFGHNVPDFPLSEENGGVSNHVSMTTPGNSFGAHYCRGLPRGELKQIIKPSPEFWGCHIIGIAPKGRMMPACISRSGTGFATAAKFFAGKVTDSLFRQPFRERLCIKLGQFSAAGQAPDIYKRLDAMGMKKGKEDLQRAV